MIMKGRAVRISIVVEAGTKAIPSALDLVITDPKGHQEYKSMSASGVTYTPPVIGVPGSYVFAKTFNMTGLWKIQLDKGNAGIHDIIFEELVNVVDHTPRIDTLLYLP